MSTNIETKARDIITEAVESLDKNNTDSANLIIGESIYELLPYLQKVCEERNKINMKYILSIETFKDPTEGYPDRLNVSRKENLFKIINGPEKTEFLKSLGLADSESTLTFEVRNNSMDIKMHVHIDSITRKDESGNSFWFEGTVLTTSKNVEGEYKFDGNNKEGLIEYLE